MTDQKVQQDESQLVAARRAKMGRWIDDYGVYPWGHRVDGLMSLEDARAAFNQEAHDSFKEDGNNDSRPIVKVAGRCIQHRAMGKLKDRLMRRMEDRELSRGKFLTEGGRKVAESQRFLASLGRTRRG